MCVGSYSLFGTRIKIHTDLWGNFWCQKKQFKNHLWSFLVIRGHFCSLVVIRVTSVHSCVLLDKTILIGSNDNDLCQQNRFVCIRFIPWMIFSEIF